MLITIMEHQKLKTSSILRSRANLSFNQNPNRTQETIHLRDKTAKNQAQETQECQNNNSKNQLKIYSHLAETLN